MEYIATRWPDGPSAATQQATATVTVTINAANHLESLELSGLKEPGALISVNGLGMMNIRYRIDHSGNAIELAHYGSVDQINTP